MKNFIRVPCVRMDTLEICDSLIAISTIQVVMPRIEDRLSTINSEIIVGKRKCYVTILTVDEIQKLIENVEG